MASISEPIGVATSSLFRGDINAGADRSAFPFGESTRRGIGARRADIATINSIRNTLLRYQVYTQPTFYGSPFRASPTFPEGDSKDNTAVPAFPVGEGGTKCRRGDLIEARQRRKISFVILSKRESAPRENLILNARSAGASAQKTNYCFTIH